VLVIDEDAERIFHIRFKHLLLRDEWYRCEGELLELIERYSELWRSGRKIIIRNGL
jgi:hypothetical protein